MEDEPKAVRKRQCLEEIRDIIYKIGPWSVNINLLARKYDFEWRSVNRWYTNILKDTPRSTIDNIKIMGQASIKTAMAAYEKIMVDPRSSPHLKLEAIGKMNETIKHYTEFLEKYNLKAKIADDINLSLTGAVDVDKILKIAEESKVTDNAEATK